MIDTFIQFVQEHYIVTFFILAVVVLVVQQIIVELHIRKLIKKYGSFEKIPADELFPCRDEYY